MPRTTVYIRDKDWEKWKIIENKAELISQAINRSVISAVETKKGVRAHHEVEPPKNSFVAPEKTTHFCKHDQVKGFCKKGCK